MDYSEFTTEEKREHLRNILRNVERQHWERTFERDRSIAIIKAIEERGAGTMSAAIGNKRLLSQRAQQQRDARDAAQMDIAILEADMERVKREIEALPTADVEHAADDESETG